MKVSYVANVKRVILDVDTGIDDALSIMYLLKQPNVIVEGITTGYGNVSAEQATENTLKIIELMEKSGEVPVAMGATQPLLRAWGGPVVAFHGENGIGGIELPKPKQSPLDEHAADFIVRKVNEYPNEITLIFVGRLTNLAIALAKDSELPKKVKELVIMGGAVQVPGNVTPVSEANIAGDPDAAHMIFSAGFNLTMVGLDVTMKAHFTVHHVELLKEKCQHSEEHTKLANIIQEMLVGRFEAYRDHHEVLGSPLHDPLAVAVALDETLVEKTPLLVMVETKGTLSLGATIADLRIGKNLNPNVNVCLKVDAERFLNHFIDSLAN
jgi:purine nucleosidase